MSFFLGFGRLSRPKPSGILMLAVGRAAPAQFSAAGREFTRRSAHGPEGPDRRCISSNSPKAKNIDFNRSLQVKSRILRNQNTAFFGIIDFLLDIYFVTVTLAEPGHILRFRFGFFFCFRSRFGWIAYENSEKRSAI